MGDQRRLIGRLAVLLVLLGAAGCTQEADVERRRELLKGRDRAQEARDRLAKTRVRSLEGELLPSETKAAGIVIPRGFELKYTLPHQWYFDAALPVDKVEKYFGQRLRFDAVNRLAEHDLELTEAREKADPAMEPVLVRIAPLPGRPDVTRIQILERDKTVAPITPDADAKPRLAEARRVAL